MSKLHEIFENKAAEIAVAKSTIASNEMRRMAADAPPVRPFRTALSDSGKPLALIAEVKKASPSKGLIRANFDPIKIAAAYRDAGAQCLSVLTDSTYFQGSRQNLELARAASGLPCLRKDFVCDPYQVYEARAWGADAILLIVAAFMPSTLAIPWSSAAKAGHSIACLGALWTLGKDLGMDVLVEVHNREEVEVALRFGADLIGVNNRDLSDMTTSLAISEELLPLIAPHALAVSESALEKHSDLSRVQAAGAKAVLIGTTFCASPDIQSKVREVMEW
jgi:indole-3-glycerol phosphate synthase